jgi:hypothetical protein
VVQVRDGIVTQQPEVPPAPAISAILQELETESLLSDRAIIGGFDPTLGFPSEMAIVRPRPGQKMFSLVVDKRFSVSEFEALP